MATDSSGLSSGGSRIQNTPAQAGNAGASRGGSVVSLPQALAGQSGAQSLLGRVISAPNSQGLLQVETAQGRVDVQLNGNQRQNAQFQAGRSVQVNIAALNNDSNAQSSIRQASVSLAADKITPSASQNSSSQSQATQNQTAQRSIDTTVPYPSRYELNTQAQSRAQNPNAQNQTTQLAQGQSISTRAATPQQVRVVPPIQTQAQVTQLPQQTLQSIQPQQAVQQSQPAAPQQVQPAQGPIQNTQAQAQGVTVERPVLPAPAGSAQAAQSKPQIAQAQGQGQAQTPVQAQGQIQAQNIQDISLQYVRQNFSVQPGLSNFSGAGGSLSNTAQAIVQAVYAQPLSALQTALGADRSGAAAPSLQANIAGQFQNLVQQIQRGDPLSKLFAHRFIGAQGGSFSAGGISAGGISAGASMAGQGGGFSLSALQSALSAESGSTIQQAGQHAAQFSGQSSGQSWGQQGIAARLTPFQNLSALAHSLLNNASASSTQTPGLSQGSLNALASTLQSGAGNLPLNGAGAATGHFITQGRFGQMITAAGQGMLLDVRIQNISNTQSFQISNFAQNAKGEMQNALMGQGGASSQNSNQSVRQFAYGQVNNTLTPQTQSATSPMQNISMPSPFMTRFGQAGQLFGMITGVNASGQMIMSLSDGVSRFSGQYVLPQNIQPLRSGTVLTLDVLQARVAGPQGQAVGPVFKGLNGFFQAMGYANQGWGDLQESFDILRSKLSPDDMQATLRAVPTVVSGASGAESGMRLSSQILFFIAALKGGDISNWLGERNSNTLKAERGGALFSRMARGFEGLSRGLNEASNVQNGEWRSASIPTFFGADLSKLNMHIRDYFHDGLSDDELLEKPDKRFVIDFSLSRMGDMQIDSLMTHPSADGVRRLETVLRTQEGLGSEMRQELRQKYSAVMRGVGYHGYLDFQTLGQANP